MQGRLSLTTPAYVLAASPTIHKDLFDKLKVQRMETNEYEAVCTGDWEASTAIALALHCTMVHDDITDLAFTTVNHTLSINDQEPDFCLPLQELDVLVNGSVKVSTILNTGSQIVIIRHYIIHSL